MPRTGGGTRSGVTMPPNTKGGRGKSAYIDAAHRVHARVEDYETFSILVCIADLQCVDGFGEE